jgi:acyl-coenzyme A thioesterase PaaI-like protein
MSGELLLMGQLHEALAGAARQRLSDTSRALCATDIHLLFTGAAQGALRASAEVTGGGRSLCFCEAELRDAQGQTVARAMGTFRYA